MLTVEQIPKLCYPIDYTIDRTLFNDSFKILLERLSITYNDTSWFSINLTHLPGLQGSDRWNKWTEKHKILKNAGVNELDFSEHLLEMQDLYIGQVIQEIENRHATKFQGRTQLIWLGPGASYPIHIDTHSSARYHIPIITNEKCYWEFLMFEKSYRLHMPVDNRVWFVNPRLKAHSFHNDSNTTRCHLVMSSSAE